MKKKNIIISGLLTAALLAGCGGNGHTHAPQGGWKWNGTEHWNLCECEEKFDVAAHKLGDDLVCADCGVEVWLMDDGSADTYTYDQYGNFLTMASFDVEGNVTSESCYEYEYDAEGRILMARYYDNGDLQNEDTYTVDGAGESVITKSMMYYDGESILNEYDADGNVIHVQCINAEGTIIEESWSEYAMNNEGEFYEAKCTMVTEDGQKLIATYNEHDDILSRTWYDAEGNVTSEDTWEYGYNDDGESMWQKDYVAGVLVYEIIGYAELHTEDYSMRYPETVIEYYEDGSKLVKFHGSNGEVETETLYNADGSVASVLTYTYETFEDGNWKSIKVYEGETLVRESQYAMGEDGFSYEETLTEYHEDGTYTVTTFQEDGSDDGGVTFDASGNVIAKP